VEQTKQQFQNEHIKVSLSQNPGCMAHLEVEVDAVAVQSAHAQAVKAVKKEVSIPGFRKGKVPDDVVKHNFAAAIAREFRDCVMQTAFRESLTLTNLKPFGSQSVKRSELKKCSQEEGALATFDVEVEPQIPTIDINAIETAPIATRTITPEHIERAYRQLRVMHGTWEEIKNRAVTDGDFVEVDIDVTEHPAHNVCTNQLLLVQSDELPKWLYDTMIGMDLEENNSKDAVAQPRAEDPAHIFVQDKDAPAKQCRVTLKIIKSSIMPEETEEFAQKVGASSIADLKTKLETRLTLEEAEYASDLARYNLRRELLQKYPFDLPRSLVDAEVRARVAYCKEGSDIATGSLPSDQSKDAQLKEQIEAEARGFFAWMYLLRQITPQANVGVTQQELEAEYQYQMRLPRLHRMIYPGLTPEDVRNRLFMLILMHKCEAFLLDLKTKTDAVAK
jgi:trigger factor